MDSEPAGLDVLQEEAGKIGVAMRRDAMDAEFRGKSTPYCIAAIARRLDCKPPGFEEDFERRLREATAARFRRGLAPMPGARELLSRLRLPYRIVSNGRRDKMELTLGLCGLWPLVRDKIISAYDIGCFKPSPGLFLYAAKAMGVHPHACGVVEDSLPGLVAGLDAGMQVFSLAHPGEVPAQLAGRVRFIASLGGFDRLLHGAWLSP